MKNHSVTPPRIGNRIPLARYRLPSRQETLVQVFRNLRRRLGNGVLGANKGIETKH